MEVVMIVVSLALLVTIAYKCFSVILFAPVCALVAASMAEYHLLPAYTDLFMGKAVVFVKSFFPIFLLGAVFGKVMEETPDGFFLFLFEEVVAFRDVVQIFQVTEKGSRINKVFVCVIKICN